MLGLFQDAAYFLLLDLCSATLFTECCSRLLWRQL